MAEDGVRSVEDEHESDSAAEHGEKSVVDYQAEALGREGTQEADRSAENED